MHAEPKYTGRFTISMESVTEVLDRREIIKRVTALMDEVEGRETAAIERAVKLGWYLLQMHEQLIPFRGSWYQFLREIKIHEKTARRRMSLVIKVGGQHGVTDLAKVKAYVEHYEELAGVTITPKDELTLRSVEVAYGVRTPEQTSSSRGPMGPASVSVRSVPPEQNSSSRGPMGPASVSVRSVTDDDEGPWGGRRDDIEDEVEGDDDEPAGGWGNDDFGGDVDDEELPPPATIVQAPAKPASAAVVQAPAKPAGAAGAQMTFDAIYDAAMARIATKFTEFRSAPMSTARRAALRWFAEDMEAKLQTIMREVP